jgi:hypothetical protein
VQISEPKELLKQSAITYVVYLMYLYIINPTSINFDNCYREGAQGDAESIKGGLRPLVVG